MILFSCDTNILLHSLNANSPRHDLARTFVNSLDSRFRMAFTLRHYGVTHFATQNLKDFQGFGFREVFDPLT